jgi:multidrug efflux pump subunit AcrB
VSLSDFALRNRQFTLVVFAMLVALGVSSLLRIPRAEDPVFPYPNFGVLVVYPGASPGDVEQLVVEPLEKVIKPLEGLKKLQSTMGDGVGFLRVEFNAEEDADRKYDELLREVNARASSLPAEVTRVEVTRFQANNVAILQMALVAPSLPYATLKTLGEALEKRFEAVPGVKEAKVWAYPQQEARVSLDPARLAAAHLSLGQVLQAVQAGNLNIPGGSVDLGARRFTVKTSGDLGSLEALAEVVVGSSGAQGVVRLRDVAAVELRDQDTSHLARLNGQRAIFVTATMKDKQNIFQVREGLAEAAARFAPTLPEGARLETGFDQSLNVERRLHGFTIDFAIAIALVLLTLLPLGLRASAVVMLSIPLSLALGLSLLEAFGYTINQLSIVGFVLALGLLVDDSIVVVENIARTLRAGGTRLEAALAGTRQIGVAVLGCTATLIFAFLPVLFLPGVAGKFIRSLPLAVVFTVLASLLVSLTIVPLLASVFLDEAPDAHGNVFLRGLNRVIEGSYRRVLNVAIAWPRATVGAAGLLFVGALALVPVVGFSLFPKAGLRQFLVQVETTQGTSLDETDRQVQRVEALLASRPEVESVLANVGRGNPQVYYNAIPANESSSVGELLVQLKAYDPVTSPVFIDGLRRELAQVPGARIEVKEFSNGPPVDAPVAIRLIGNDLKTLERLAGQVEAVLKATPGTRDVKNPIADRRTDLRLAVDRSRAGLFGVPVAEIDRTVRMGLAGLHAGAVRDAAGDELDITVRLPAEPRATLVGLERLGVATLAGGQVPLMQVAQVQLEAGPTAITHYGRERSTTVTAEVQTGFNTDRVTRDVLASLEKLPIPAGHRWVAAGELESRNESFGGLGTAAIIAAFGILAVLVLEFGTFRSTAIVASVIPLGLVGGIAALYLSGNTLSFTAAIGFIALVGIEVKNSILLVDFTNQLRAQGLGLDAAIQQAGETRFVPILLTTATALGGLIPLALERSPLYSPLALVIMGGLVSSTILTRVVTPVMYKLLAPEVKRIDGTQGTP